MNSLDNINNSIDIDNSLNTIFLVGNGFDLAHELKTSYLDFFADVLAKNKKTDSDFVELVRDKLKTNPHISFINDLVSDIESSFLKDVYKTYSEFLWIDIENAYFDGLFNIINNSKIPEEYKSDNIKAYNNDFENVANLLSVYISQIDKSINYSMKKSIIVGNITKYKSTTANYVLNFNYTQTFNLYLEDLELSTKNAELYHINGKIDNNDPSRNNIIFGNGDEFSDKFNKIREYNEALTHFKSLQYSIRPEYYNISNIIKEPYNLIILGHSCGTPDRTLLATLVNNDNINKLIIRCKNRDDNFRSLRYLKQSSTNGKIFNADISQGLCQQ